MKTNKTKPIKKLMIFTIITVMIVSLFAVPAFALTPENGIEWGTVSGNVTPIDFTYSGDGSSESVNTDGYYLVTFTMSALRSALSCVGSENMGSSYTLRPLNGSTVSYTRVFTSTADEYFYCNKIDGSNDLFYLEFKFTGGSEELVMNVPYGSTNRTYDLNSVTAPMEISFIVTDFPPSLVSSNLTTVFWNNLDYTVQQYGVSTNPPTDPDPDDPTPPADGEEQGIFAVWSKITQWIVQGLASVSNAFYANGKLTLLGTLCIIPIALGIAFLLIAIIQKFLRLRG